MSTNNVMRAAIKKTDTDSSAILQTVLLLLQVFIGCRLYCSLV